MGVDDVQMTSISMVASTAKWTPAPIPALIILVAIAAAPAGIFAGLVAGLMNR